MARIPPLTIPELQAFVHVARAGSFRAAAELAFISQPALSRRIQSAEFKLGAELFDREARPVELTSFGRELLPIAERILEQFDDSLSELSEYMSGGRGHITIACLPSFGAIILPGVLSEFRQVRPLVTVALKPVDPTSILELVRSGSADFAVTSPPPPDASLEYASFVLADELVVICSHHDPLAQRSEVSWPLFATRPYISSGVDSSITPVVERALQTYGIEMGAQYEAANISVLGALVAEGLGIAAIPRRSLHLVDTNRVKVLPLAGAPFNREAGVLRLKGRRLSLAAEGFLDILVKRMADWKAHGADR